MMSPGSDCWSKEKENPDLKRDCEERLGWATPSLRLRWAGQRRQWVEERTGLEAEAAFIGGPLRPGAGVLPGNLRVARKG